MVCRNWSETNPNHKTITSYITWSICCVDCALWISILDISSFSSSCSTSITLFHSSSRWLTTTNGQNTQLDNETHNWISNWSNIDTQLLLLLFFLLEQFSSKSLRLHHVKSDPGEISTSAANQQCPPGASNRLSMSTVPDQQYTCTYLLCTA